MLYMVTISYPGLEADVQETIQATNYANMLTTAHFLTAAVERINSSEHTSLDVLFAYIHSLAPELRDWAYEAEDDWLLADNLKMVADKVKYLLRPFMPPSGIPKYYSHTDDTLTVLIKTLEGYHYAF